MATPLPPTPKARPYRRFLTSALHSRFIHAALLSLPVALGNAFLLGSNRDAFWSWFPFGPAGIKALLFFVSSLFIFFLQIATLQVGRQTTTSPFATFRRYLCSVASIQALWWYACSAFWFTEVYIWSSPDLGWITRGGPTAPDRLNERPIFFRAYSLMLASVYAAIHLYLGHSFLVIPIAPPPSTRDADQRTHPLEPAQSQLARRAVPTLVRAASSSFATLVCGPFVYGMLLRQAFWQGHLYMAKPFFNLSRANSFPDRFPPLGIPYLLKCWLAGFLLALTWEITAALFVTSLAQEPLKKGLPLSSSSKDPNATLLNGLKAKRDIVKTCAFWELAIIAQKHPDRRKAIFEDIERPGGTMWSQMLEATLQVLKDVDVRINGSPPPSRHTSDVQINSLPHLLPPLKEQRVLVASRDSAADMLISKPARKLGSSREPWHPPLDKATHAIEPYKKEAQVQLDKTINDIQRSPVGWFFTSSTPAIVTATVVGSPSGHAALIVDAIEICTKMLVASLQEDTYGRVTPTVPGTITTFTKTIASIESLVQRDRQSPNDVLEDVDIILARLRSGLRDLLAAFQIYLNDVGLGIADLNAAKKALETVDKQVEKGLVAIEEPDTDEGAGTPGEVYSKPLFPSKVRDHRHKQDKQHDSVRLEARPKFEPQSSSSFARRTNANGFVARSARQEMEQVK